MGVKARDLLGPLAFMIFLGLFVFMMNKISAPDAKFELADYVIIADLIIAFVLVMMTWSVVVHPESRVEDILPFPIPTWIAIPLAVCLFVFLYVSGLGEILLHVNEVESPALALAVAAAILGGATYLSTRPDPPSSAAESADSEHQAATHGEHATHEPTPAGTARH